MPDNVLGLDPELVGGAGDGGVHGCGHWDGNRVEGRRGRGGVRRGGHWGLLGTCPGWCPGGCPGARALLALAVADSGRVGGDTLAHYLGGARFVHVGELLEGLSHVRGELEGEGCRIAGSAAPGTANRRGGVRGSIVFHGAAIPPSAVVILGP